MATEMAGFAAHLADRAVVAVTGKDAESFLQGLLTCDMARVTAAAAQAGALLSPQGKIMFDLILIGCEDGYLIETSADMRDAFIKRLGFYKLRAAVTIAASPLNVFAIWNGGEPHGFADPRWGALGRRLFAESCITNAEAAAYHAHRIAEGIPEAGKDYALGDTFPHEANFDLLNGVSFEKGCYVGQEVVSRTKHRGTARKRILPFAITGDSTPHSPVTADEMVLGTLGSSASGRALALVRMDRLEDALNAGKLLRAGSAELKPLQPAWANFMISGHAA